MQSLQGASAGGRRDRRQSEHEPHKRGRNTKRHWAVDAPGLPVRAIVTEGTRAECQEAGGLIDGIEAEYLLADRGYDVNALIEQAISQGITPVIPPKKHRVELRDYDKEQYRLRHRVENAFLHLKRWRGIATRYAKNTASFLASIHIRCMALWIGIS